MDAMFLVVNKINFERNNPKSNLLELLDLAYRV